jgi:hypothetical protein
MRGVRAPTPPHGQSWKTFLAIHTVWACDFLQVYDIWFRSLFAFFVIDIKSREVIHVGVTRAPTEQWMAQQLRNVTPFGESPDVIIRHYDNKFGAEFDILGQRHFANVLNEYSFRYFNKSRPHQGIRQRIPSPLAAKKFTAGDTIRSIPILDGLHHDYEVAA